MYAVGAYLVVGPLAVGVAVAGVVAILLHLKPELHSIASQLDRDDLKAIMQFVLVTFVVLPVLPDRTYGPLSGLQSVYRLADGGPHCRNQPGRISGLPVSRPQGRRAGRRHPRRTDFEHGNNRELFPLGDFVPGQFRSPSPS